MTKNMYVLIGAPGVGKTTWVQREFQDECFVVSSDDIIQAVADDEGKTYDETFPTYIKAAEALMWKQFDEHVSGRYDPIVIDRTNMSVKARRRIFDRLKTFHKGHGYNIHAVVFKAPDEVEHKRRLASRPGKYIPENAIKSMLAAYQEPTTEEGFSTITFV